MWEQAKHLGVQLTVVGIKGRIYAALRVLFTGVIITGATWGQLDDNIQSFKNKTKKMPTISNQEVK